ncbi:glycerophosphodiester phosphodiesterase family protein [Halobacteriovorax sp. HLS]|uniref:glycerophosphodiester phosphodiesterase family protein n=1 Tax=Halobacteriovorax sp. HLS TaxID=2234000 RepID=UPI0013E3B8A5|nr:glycerophosphodiester phosphodiesterase family protein [Halobacteriovorax sp. HLS]
MKVPTDSWVFTRPIAHRGLHGNGVLENTIEAFDKAIKENHPIELDIRVTKDDKLVVFHDRTTSRIFTENLDVEKSHLSDLLKLEAKENSAKIPTLENILEYVDGRVPLLIEIKNENFDGRLERLLVDQLRNYHHEFSIQSFNPWSLKEISRLAPDFSIGLLSGTFKKSKMNFFSKLALRNLIFIPYLRPDFLSLEFSGYSGIQRRIAEIYGSERVIFWTIRDKKQLPLLGKHNYIFDNFEDNK